MTSMPVPYVGRHRRELPKHRAANPVDACSDTGGQGTTPCLLCRGYMGRHRKDTP